jgi:SPP1 family predicted phage head-tail adaptor
VVPLVRNVGELRHRVTLSRPGARFDDNGFPLGDAGGAWEPVLTVWALARDVSGKEFFEAHTTKALNVVTFETRALRLPVDNAWSVLWRGARYRVIHINHRDYKGQWWEIKAQAVSDG